MFWGHLFGVTRGGGVTKENSYFLASLITGCFFPSVSYVVQGWLLAFFTELQSSFLSCVLILLVILFLIAGHSLFLCFDFLFLF